MKSDEKERLTSIVDSFFCDTHRHTRTNFCDYMTSQGVNAIFRESKDGRVYGLTFIDHKSGAVFNGSDLGKLYSGQVLMKRLEATPRTNAIEKGRWSTEIERSQLKPEDFTAYHPSGAFTKEFLALMKPMKSGEEPINPNLKRTRKKKRGISR